MNYSEEKAVNALCEVVTRHIEATNRLQTANNETWWKLRESSILALSKVKDVVVERQKAGMLHFDIISLLDTIILATLKDSGIWLYFVSIKIVSSFLLSLVFIRLLSYITNFRSTAVTPWSLFVHWWQIRRDNATRDKFTIFGSNC